MSRNYDNEIQDVSSLKRYRTEIPNIVMELGLTPFELALYIHLKKTAGEGGVCFKNTKTLADETGMSVGMVSKAKDGLTQRHRSLGGKALVTIKKDSTNSGRAKDIITIVDVWPENFKTNTEKYRKQSSPGELQSSYSEFQSSCDELQSSPGEPNKEPYEEEPYEESTVGEFGSASRPPIVAQHSTSGPKGKTKPLEKWGAAAAAIYEAYPRHTGKQPALVAIAKALERIEKGTIADKPDGVLDWEWPPLCAHSWLLERTKSYALERQGKEEQFTPHPATWFNQARYTDASKTKRRLTDAELDALAAKYAKPQEESIHG